MIAPTRMIHPKGKKKGITRGKAVVGVLPCLAQKNVNQYQFQYQANYYSFRPPTDSFAFIGFILLYSSSVKLSVATHLTSSPYFVIIHTIPQINLCDPFHQAS